MQRPDGRPADALRPVEIHKGYLKQPHGSVLITCGETKVICTASVEDRVPAFLKDTEKGWITSEYAMLPAATDQRTQREVTRGRPTGRSQEIQRLIGRSLRAAVDRKALGERTIWLDCDVIQADGGTRTASITGAFVALALALARLQSAGRLKNPPLLSQVSAVSVGIVEGCPVLDLCYEEDSAADTDMNVVMADGNRFVEIQGTAEGGAFSRDLLDRLLDLAVKGNHRLMEIQHQVLGECLTGLLLPPLGSSVQGSA